MKISYPILFMLHFLREVHTITQTDMKKLRTTNDKLQQAVPPQPTKQQHDKINLQH